MKTIVLASLAALQATAKPLDGDALLNSYFNADADWFRDRIPLFEVSDESIQDVYYYRWNMFRTHQRNIGDYGFISTEFIDNVGWQTQPWASNNCAAVFHLKEGRWCRDPRYRRDYANFMYSKDSNPRQYTEGLADGVWASYLVDGDLEPAIALLQAMQDNWEGWVDTRYDESKGLFWIEPLQDATEYTIASIDASGAVDGFGGGAAFRPTFNSYQVANARAIAKIAGLAGGNQEVVDLYNTRAKDLKDTLQQDLWNSTFEHFVDRYYVDNDFVNYWEFIRGRELAGIVPWTHEVPDDTEEFAAAWKHVLDSERLAGPFGLRTVEPTYEHYMRVWRYEGDQTECHWNGPSWPYQTTQVLTALANVLDNYPITARAISVGDYNRLLKQYAETHYNKAHNGVLDLEENYDPDTGEPIVGLGRSHHYFHSGFVDVVLSGLVGIRPREDAVLEVNPLVDESQISSFRAENIFYHGRNVSIQWDADGSKYGEPGLRVEVDGQVAESADGLQRLEVPLEGADIPLQRPTSKTIQLQADREPPVVESSVEGADQNRAHDVFDGRIWFWPETSIANGFDTPEGDGNEQWVSINLGEGGSVTSSRAEIAFYENKEQGFGVPASYKVQRLDGADWVDVPESNYSEPMVNGITKASWTEVSSQGWRVLVTPQNGLRARLVEATIVNAA